MTTLRKSSSYLILLVTDDPNKTLDEIVARATRLGYPVETTSKYTGMCGLRFRDLTDDAAAHRAAAQIADGREFTLHTGYGTHQRQVVGA